MGPGVHCAPSTKWNSREPGVPKQMKKLEKGIRILIMGTDHKPFDGEHKQVATVYDKVLSIPRPDYGTRRLLWRETLLREGASYLHLKTGLDISSLTKISDGYTAGDITHSIRQVLTARRIQTLAYKPLLASEFVPPLARLDPVFAELEQAFQIWMTKTSLGKARDALFKPPDEDGGGKKGKKGGGKKKKKK